MRTKPTPVPSTVASTASQVHGIGNPAICDDGGQLDLNPEPVLPAGDIAVSMERVSNKNGSEFITKLQAMVENLPKSVPEGSMNDRLARFSVNPQDYDDPSLDADGLWEEVLNSFLKGVLGWGTEESIDGVDTPPVCLPTEIALSTKSTVQARLSTSVGVRNHPLSIVYKLSNCRSLN